MKKRKDIIEQPLFIHKFQDGSTTAVYKDAHSVTHYLYLNKVIYTQHKNIDEAKQWIQLEEAKQKNSKQMGDYMKKEVFKQTLTDDDLYTPDIATDWENKILTNIENTSLSEYFNIESQNPSLTHNKTIATLQYLANKNEKEGNLLHALFLYTILAANNRPNAILWLKTVATSNFIIEDRVI